MALYLLYMGVATHVIICLQYHPLMSLQQLLMLDYKTSSGLWLKGLPFRLPHPSSVGGFLTLTKTCIHTYRLLVWACSAWCNDVSYMLYNCCAQYSPTVKNYHSQIRAYISNTNKGVKVAPALLFYYYYYYSFSSSSSSYYYYHTLLYIDAAPCGQM